MAFLGCSRGLGRAVTQIMSQGELLQKALLVSRSTKALETLAQELSQQSHSCDLDFSRPADVTSLCHEIKSLRPKRIFYFAGGGPYGEYGSKEWKDHQWAWQVSFLTPAQLIHVILSDPTYKFVEQVICVGSLIADSRPDHRAASYASAKHALKGLISSLHLENLSLDLRLFRPGYMNTGLLPPNAEPRQQPNTLAEPEVVAQEFVSWALDPKGSKIYDSRA